PQSHTHTHTHTCAYTHTCTHTHVHTHTHTHMCTHIKWLFKFHLSFICLHLSHFLSVISYTVIFYCILMYTEIERDREREREDMFTKQTRGQQSRRYSNRHMQRVLYLDTPTQKR